MVRVVILMQENKTPDFYFPTLAAWGANIQNRGNLLKAPPLPDPTHDRDRSRRRPSTQRLPVLTQATTNFRYSTAQRWRRDLASSAVLRQARKPTMHGAWPAEPACAANKIHWRRPHATSPAPCHR